MFQGKPIVRGFGTIAAIAMFGVGALMVSLAPGDASSGTQLVHSGATVQSGQSFSTSASVSLAAADTLNGFDVTVSFDPAVVKPTGVSIDGVWNIPLDSGTIGANTVHVAASRIGSCTGSCPLFSLNWKAQGSGDAKVKAASFVLVGKQSDVAGNLAQVTPAFAAVIVSGPANSTATATNTPIPPTATKTALPVTHTPRPATSTPVGANTTQASSPTPTTTIPATISAATSSTPTSTVTLATPSTIPTVAASVDGSNTPTNSSSSGSAAPPPSTPAPSSPADSDNSSPAVALATSAPNAAPAVNSDKASPTRTSPLPPNAGMSWSTGGRGGLPLRPSGFVLMGMAALLMAVQVVKSRQVARDSNRFATAVEGFFAEQERRGQSRPE